jgi:hydroxyacylglutathione hydrolase
MKIKQFEVPGLAQYSYVLSSAGEAIVIDPMRDFDRYITYASQQDLTIKFVTETHIHADFASGSIALAEAVQAELALSGYDAGEHYRYTMKHRELRDSDGIEAGSIKLVALHTPGHTPEHLSFVLFDMERSATEPVAIFTGDFLFVGSLGRPDLLGEDAKQALAHELYKSLHERIASLHDGVQVFPGHGAGSFCGAGMSEQSESTLGYERTTQPLFHLDEVSFVRTILSSVPPMPSYYPRMKQLNSEGAPSVRSLPEAKGFAPVEFAKAISEGDAIVLDLRRPEAFGGAHIADAVNIGAGQNLLLWAGWLLDSHRPIYLVSDKGDDEASRRALLRVGLDRLGGFLSKGMVAWIDAGLDFTQIPQLSTQKVESRDSTTLVLDVRSDAEWTKGHIHGAKHIMLGDLTERLEELSRSIPIITVCGSGYRSSIAASVLQKAGFEMVSSMDGGMTAWKRQALAVVN